MNGKDLKEFRKKLRLTQTELANLIGRTTMRTVQNWESEKNPVPEFVETFLNDELKKRNTNIFVSKEIIKTGNEKADNFNSLPIGDQMQILHQENKELKELLLTQGKEMMDYKNTIIEYIDDYLKPIFDFIQENINEKKKSD